MPTGNCGDGKGGFQAGNRCQAKGRRVRKRSHFARPRTGQALDRLQARYDAHPVLTIPVSHGDERWTIRVKRSAYHLDPTERLSGARRYRIEMLDHNGDWHDAETANDEARARAIAHTMARRLTVTLKRGW